MSDQLEVRYVQLDQAMRWDNNKKRHDIGKLVESFERHGFKDPPKFEPALNGGSGGIVEGNGRFEALGAMRSDKQPAPRGIMVAEDGAWLVPVLFGVDAASERAAEAYGVDHNALTLSGGDFDLTDHMRLWEDGFEDLLKDLALGDELPVAFDGDDLDRLIAATQVPSADAWADATGGLPDSDRAPFQQMTFTLHDSQVEQIKDALRVAIGQGPFDSENQNSNGNALARICETYLTDYGQG